MADRGGRRSKNGEDPRPVKDDSASELYRLAKSRRESPLRRAAKFPPFNSYLLEPRTSHLYEDAVPENFNRTVCFVPSLLFKDRYERYS